MGGITSPERVLIVDDHSLVRDGLRSIFDDAFPACATLEADSLESALRTLADEGDVDLVLLDLNIPDVSHLSGLEALRDTFPATPVVMVSGVTDRKVVRDALAAGAAGFVPKSLKRAAIVDALNQVLSGELFMPELEGDDTAAGEEDMIRARIDSLTPQQRVVLGHLVAGRLNKQIAYDLGLSEQTVKMHRAALLDRLGAATTADAIRIAVEANISSPAQA